MCSIGWVTIGADGAIAWLIICRWTRCHRRSPHFRDDLAADHLTAILIERECRLTVELPAVVERMRHTMTKRSVVLACEIAINLHRPVLRAAVCRLLYLNTSFKSAIAGFTRSPRRRGRAASAVGAGRVSGRS